MLKFFSPSAGGVCSVNNGGCSHVCVDEAWGTLCVCPIGYKLSPNGTVCEGVTWRLLHPRLLILPSLENCYYFYWKKLSLSNLIMSSVILQVNLCWFGNIEDLLLLSVFVLFCFFTVSWTKKQFQFMTNFQMFSEYWHCLNNWWRKSILFNMLIWIKSPVHVRTAHPLSADVDECAPPSAPCMHHCTNTVGSYYCHCRNGFKLIGNSSCVTTGTETPLNKLLFWPSVVL